MKLMIDEPSKDVPWQEHEFPSYTDRDLAIQDGAYTPDQLRPLLAQAELAPFTISSRDFEAVKDPIINMCVVSLAHRDGDAFRGWKKYAEDISVARLTIAENDNAYLDELNSNELLTSVRFLGAIGGDTESAQELHDQLRLNPTQLGDVVKLCSDYNVDPTSWIDQFAQSADNAAYQWKRYFIRYKGQHAKQGKYPTGTELQRAGTKTFVRSVANGTISDEMLDETGSIAFELADDQQKAEIASRYIAALRQGDMSDSFTIGTPAAQLIMASRVVSRGEKDTIYRMCMAERDQLRERIVSGEEIDHWGAVGLHLAMSHYNDIEVAYTAATTESPNAILEAVGRLTANASKDTDVRYVHDRLCEIAARTLMEMGRYDAAATLIANINEGNSWSDAVDYYVYRGGDITAIQHEDQFQVMSLPQGMGGRTSELPDWSAREHILLFHKALKAKDFEGAKNALMVAIDTRSDKGERHIDHGPYPKYVGMLLERAPQYASEIAQHEPTLAEGEASESFMASGSPEGNAAMKEELARTQGWGEWVSYFKYYARMAVAQPVVVQAVRRSLVL